jgi:hypothetical protein
MKFLTFIFGLIIGVVAAYGAVAADVLELPFLEKEDEVVVEEPVEVEEEEENLFVKGYTFNRETNSINFADASYNISDEFIAMLEETDGSINNYTLPYSEESPEIVYIGVAFGDPYEEELTSTDTDIYEYNLKTNEYKKKFNYTANGMATAKPLAVTGNKLIVDIFPTGGFGPGLCADPLTMFEKMYFDLDDPNTVAMEYELPENILKQVELGKAECEFLIDITGFELA